MDPNDVRWEPTQTEGTSREVEHEHAPPASLAPAVPGSQGGLAGLRRPGLRRMIGTLVLAGGLLAVGGASVVMAASPAPSASTSPSTMNHAGGYGPGSMAGGCHHNGTTGSGGGSSSPNASPGA